MSRAPDADGWVSLSDVQWMNIVNHEHAYAESSKDDAVHAAVKMTEAKLRQLNVPAAPAAVVQAEPSEWTAAQMTAAARALADRSADACNVNREDNWHIYYSEFMDDAALVCAAVRGVK